MRFAAKIGTKYAILIALIFKQYTLNRLAWLFSLLFWNAHNNKAAGNTSTGGLVYAAVIFNIFAFPGSIPIVWIKGRIAFFIGNDKIKTDLDAGGNTLPA